MCKYDKVLQEARDYVVNLLESLLNLIHLKEDNIPFEIQVSTEEVIKGREAIRVIKAREVSNA